MAKEVSKEGLSKAERIEAASKALDKLFGKGTVIGANEQSKYHPVISTGSLGLNKALGIGGLPKGRIVEMMGWESSGKTTIALQTIAEAHKDPESWCAFIDVEHALNTAYAAQLGVDLDRLKISQPFNAEEALEIAETFVKTGDMDVIVLDSIAALVPKAEVERGMGESSMGKQAMLMSQACRKLTPLVAKSGTLFIFINQMREKIGVMFGSPDTTPGGNSMKFYASIRLNISRSVTASNSVTNKDDQKIGNLTKIRVIKNKLAPPFRECEFNIMFGVGIDKYSELLEMAVESGVVTKAGPSYSYGLDKLAVGKDNVIQLLRDATRNASSIYEDIKRDVINSYTPKEYEATEKEVEDANF